MESSPNVELLIHVAMFSTNAIKYG